MATFPVGIDDVLIGTNSDYRGGSRRYEGQAYVIFGRDHATAEFPAEIEVSALQPANGGDGSVGFILWGINMFDDAGISVSNAGDVNGDEIDDILIGAPRGDPGGRSAAGESYVVFGRPQTAADFPAEFELSSLFPGNGGDGSAGFVLNGIDSSDYSGSSVSAAGDVNSDGVDDLVVGAPLADAAGRTAAGESYVVFGRDRTAFPAILNLSTLLPESGGNGSAGFILNGIDSLDYSGTALSAAGDVNGDGIDDLIVGARGADPGGRSAAGESYVLFGKLTGDDVLFTSMPVTDATVGMVYTYNVTAEDPDPEDAGEALTITDGGTLPAWLALTDNGDGTATLSGTPAITDIGDVAVTLTVTNTVDSTSTNQMFTITVAAADPLNTPPAFTSTPVTAATVDETYTYNVTAEDADGDTLTIEAVTLPAWLTLTDNADGMATLSGTPAAADAGTHEVSLQVSDGAAPVTQDFTVTVTEAEPPVDTTPPVVTLIGPATVNVTVGSTYNDQGATATDNVDGDLTDEIVTDSNVDTSTAGSYTVTYDVTDAAGNEAATVARTVNVSQPPRDGGGGGGGSLGLWSIALLGMLGATGRRRRG